MTFELKIIHVKKFLLIVLTAILIGYLCVSKICDLLDSIIPLFIAIPSFIIIFILIQKGCSRLFKIALNDDTLILGNEEIRLSNIEGYFLDENVSMSALSIKLKSKELLRYTLSRRGNDKIILQKFMKSFVLNLSKVNPESKELNITDLNPKQMKFIRPFVYIAIVLIVIVDILVLIWGFLPWQALFANLLILRFIPYFKKSN